MQQNERSPGDAALFVIFTEVYLLLPPFFLFCGIWFLQSVWEHKLPGRIHVWDALKINRLTGINLKGLYFARKK